MDEDLLVCREACSSRSRAATASAIIDNSLWRTVPRGTGSGFGALGFCFLRFRGNDGLVMTVVRGK